METRLVSLIVLPRHVKHVKTTLEEHGLLRRTRKITAEHGEARQEPRMVIYTDLPHQGTSVNESVLRGELERLGLGPLANNGDIWFRLYEDTPAQTNNPLLNGLKSGLQALPEEILAFVDLSVVDLVSGFPMSYSIYKPMLLLPHNAFSAKPWTCLLARHPIDSNTLTPLWKRVAQSVGVTHIAINAGIPRRKEVFEESNHHTTTIPPDENILRSPSNLSPIYGSFGPQPTSQTLCNPTPTNFASTLWVSHTQNGIHQIWAPFYTMFSRGNIREKTRLLALPSVVTSVQEAEGCTAVDLYAGIGYFAFSYKKAGVKKILCWELNPWSIEGLRRGAEKNGWTTQIFTDAELPDSNEAWMTWPSFINQTADFLIFQQSNERALSVIAVLAPSSFKLPLCEFSLPPIRHLNLGLLPTSRLSWPAAVKSIDHELGGWIHAHENVGASVIDVEKRQGEVVEEMQRYVDVWDAERGCCGSHRRNVRCEWVERVKTYAPGVVHVVFDVRVGGTREKEDRLNSDKI